MDIFSFGYSSSGDGSRRHKRRDHRCGECRDVRCLQHRPREGLPVRCPGVLRVVQRQRRRENLRDAVLLARDRRVPVDADLIAVEFDPKGGEVGGSAGGGGDLVTKTNLGRSALGCINADFCNESRIGMLFQQSARLARSELRIANVS